MKLTYTVSLTSKTCFLKTKLLSISQIFCDSVPKGQRGLNQSGLNHLPCEDEPNVETTSVKRCIENV